MTRRIPTLETERLSIRELTMEDFEAIIPVLTLTSGTDKALEAWKRWLAWTVLGYEMFAMLDQPHYGDRAITLKNSGELIGAVGIVPYIDSFGQVPAFNRRPDCPATAEVGLYWAVAPAHQRQGYATEAAGAVVAYLFRNLNLGRVIATTGTDNLASQAVMRKIGMTVAHAPKTHSPGMAVVGLLEKPNDTDRSNH